MVHTWSTRVRRGLRRQRAATDDNLRPPTPGVGSEWYRSGTVSVVAMNLRLSEAEAEALRRKAADEGRSMQEVARTAIAEYVSDRPQRLRAAIDRVRTEDAELLDRLSR
jgi:hypothetical protein